MVSIQKNRLSDVLLMASFNSFLEDMMRCTKQTDFIARQTYRCWFLVFCCEIITKAIVDSFDQKSKTNTNNKISMPHNRPENHNYLISHFILQHIANVLPMFYAPEPIRFLRPNSKSRDRPLIYLDLDLYHRFKIQSLLYHTNKN